MVQPLRARPGGAEVGFFYSLTDKAPKPDEHPLITQGAVAVGDLLLTFTILHRDPSSPERQQTLDMLASARHIRP